jgi:hypothetical protein
MAITEFAFNVLRNNNQDLIVGKFLENIRKATGDEDYSYNIFGMIPDAYTIDKDNKEVHLYEIEDTSEIGPDKLSKLGLLWFYLDEDEWNLYLHIHDRYGNHRCDVNLCIAYYTYMSQCKKTVK